MKTLTLSLFILLSFGAYADTSVSERVWFDGSSASDVVNLATEKTRTEYRTVTVPSTCYRTDYRYQCHWAPGHCRPVCDRNGRCWRSCSPSRHICRNVPVQVPYSCERRVTQSYQVFDHYVDTAVELNYDLEGLLDGAAEEFVVSATGSHHSVKLNDSQRYLTLKRRTEAQSSREGETLRQRFAYSFKFVPAEVVTETLGEGIQNVSLSNRVLTFSLGKNFNTVDFVQNLKIYQYKLIGRDNLIFDRDLRPDQMQLSSEGNQTVVRVDLSKLGVSLPSKLRVIMTTSFNPQGAELMNGDSFELETSANWVFK